MTASPKQSTVIRGWVPRILQVLSAIGEKAVGMAGAVLILVIVEHAYGRTGLGIYAYLTACLYVTRYLANFGISRHAEREAAGRDDTNTSSGHQFTHCYQAVLALGGFAAILLFIAAGFESSQTRVEERSIAYIIMALTIPLTNINRLNLAILQGRGFHSEVAGVGIRRTGFLILLVFAVSRTGLAPSFLLSAHLLAKGICAGIIR